MREATRVLARGGQPSVAESSPGMDESSPSVTPVSEDRYTGLPPTVTVGAVPPATDTTAVHGLLFVDAGCVHPWIAHPTRSSRNWCSRRTAPSLDEPASPAP